jgi:hypothetical protein
MKKPILRSVISGLLAFALVFGTVTIAPTRSSAASLSTSSSACSQNPSANSRTLI